MVIRWFLGWVGACLLLLWRATCQFKITNDPRELLRVQRKPYIYALLHAHQIAGIIISDEKNLSAMLSRSRDGDLLIKALKVRGITAVRGSSARNGQDKGGQLALAQLQKHLEKGSPCLIAVDGPKGPRNYVHAGVINLAQKSNCAILPTAVVASRYWILKKTWDLMEIPKPFSTIQMLFGEPFMCSGNFEKDRTELTKILGHLEESLGRPIIDPT